MDNVKKNNQIVWMIVIKFITQFVLQVISHLKMNVY